MPRGLKRVIAISAGAHVAVLIGFIVSSLWKPHHDGPPQNVITTKLVRLGKERPKDWLPRKTEPPPPAAKPEPTPAVAAQPSETAPSAKDRIKELSKVASALDRLKQHDEEEPEGREDGTPSGDAKEAIVGNKFATEVYNCLKANWAVEGLDESRVRNKKAAIVVRVASDGRFIESEITDSSGVPNFDQAVIRAVKRCGKVSPPDPVIRDAVKSDGIEVVFTP